MRNVSMSLAFLTVAVILLVWQLSGDDPRPILAALRASPLDRQIAIAITGMCVLWFAGSLVWQAEQVVRQDRAIAALQDRLDGVRRALGGAQTAQEDTNAALRVLADSDPEAAIATLGQQLREAEQRLVTQHSRTSAVDLQERVDDIRNRQRSLRQQLGEAIEKRRTVEPIFAELEARQEQLARSLAGLEVDAGGTSVADQLANFADRANTIMARVKAGQDGLEAIRALRDDAGRLADDLLPLQDSRTGVAAAFADLDSRLARLASDLDALEGGPEPLARRVETFSVLKQDADQRLAALTTQVGMVRTLREEVEALARLQADLDRSLGEAEADPSGRTIGERLGEFNAFAAQAGTRWAELETIVDALKATRDELLARQGRLAYLQDSQNGIRALLVETRFLSERLSRILTDLELDGDKTLVSRLNDLVNTKRETQSRIAALAEAFERMDTTRQEIDSLFVSLAATLNTYLAPSLDGTGATTAADRSTRPPDERRSQ